MFGTEEKYLKTYQPGEAFGELALLYNAPRAATIVAKTKAWLWELDRATFNHIVKDSAVNKREKFERFLETVPILEAMDQNERTKLADVIIEKTFSPGSKIITEGDDGNVFYLVISGEAYATKLISGQHLKVKWYKEGDYFGELSLLKNTPRAASIIAKSELKLAHIDRESFMSLLGPLDTILKRNMSTYQNH